MTAQPEGRSSRKICLGYTIAVGDFSYGFFTSTGEAAAAANTHIKSGMWTVVPIASLEHIHPAHRQPTRRSNK